MKLSTVFVLAMLPPQATLAIEQRALRKKIDSSLRRKLSSTTPWTSTMDSGGVTFEEAMAEPAAGNLPMAECNQ